MTAKGINPPILGILSTLALVLTAGNSIDSKL